MTHRQMNNYCDVINELEETARFELKPVMSKTQIFVKLKTILSKIYQIYLPVIRVIKWNKNNVS